MATDVSSFKDAYKTAVTADFPETAELKLGDKTCRFERLPIDLRYGTNPHQPFMAYAPISDTIPGNMIFADMKMLKGGKAGLSLTNLQDMSQALNILKYFDKPACVAMKHINPCGFAVRTGYENLVDLYTKARKCDERSHFGATVGVNRQVDEYTAEAIMKTFVEGIIAPDYTAEALAVLRRTEGTKKLNNSIRVARVSNVEKLPKFIGDNIEGLYNIRNLADGTLTFETPYLTRIRSVEDFILEPMIPNSNPEKITEKIMLQKHFLLIKSFRMR